MTHSALNKDIESLYRLPDFQSVSYHAIVNNASCEPDVVKDAIKKLHIENGIIYTTGR